jgi:dinuclear metal center YbgI/SA1388 family protein
MVEVATIAAYLDTYLRIREVPDDPNALNGLQVENSGAVARIVAAVDASQATFEGLKSGGPTSTKNSPALLLVHHGMFWDGNQPVVARRYRRLRALMDQDAALYAAHIPLDLHPDVGNNAVLSRRLGLTDLMPFGAHKGIAIGVRGTAPAAISTRTLLRERLGAVLGTPASTIRLLPGGGEAVTRIGVITGGAGSAIAQAHAAGCDAYVTGEGAAHTYLDAMELRLNVFYAGHYATETVGVQALAAHVAERFGLPWSFHDHPTGM